MRNEVEVITLILNIAKTDERIRAVLINGSRANPKIKQDKFQDFDIVYIVNKIDSFLSDHSWIDIFGESRATAEPVIYMIGETVVGGFYRYHREKCANENLNSPGMEFAPLSISEIHYRHKVIARLALIAAAREIEEVLCKNTLV